MAKVEVRTGDFFCDTCDIQQFDDGAKERLIGERVIKLRAGMAQAHDQTDRSFLYVIVEGKEKAALDNCEQKILNGECPNSDGLDPRRTVYLIGDAE